MVDNSPIYELSQKLQQHCSCGLMEGYPIITFEYYMVCSEWCNVRTPCKSQLSRNINKTKNDQWKRMSCWWDKINSMWHFIQDNLSPVGEVDYCTEWYGIYSIEGMFTSLQCYRVTREGYSLHYSGWSLEHKELQCRRRGMHMITNKIS